MIFQESRNFDDSRSSSPDSRNKKFKLFSVLLTVIIVSLLLSACGGDASTPQSGSEKATLPMADQAAKITSKPLPTSTAVPTPTLGVLLVPTVKSDPVSLRKGEPPSLLNTQAELNIYAAKFFPPTAVPIPVQPVQTVKPGQSPQPVQPVGKTPVPTGGGTGVFSVGSWQVSGNSDDIFLDTFEFGANKQQYLIVGILVKNNGGAKPFSSIGPQLVIGKNNGTTATIKPDASGAVTAYLKSSNLYDGAGVDTIYMTVPTNGIKIIYCAYNITANSTGVVSIKLVSSTPKGLSVPIN